jgi:hypothetical protein
MVLARAGWTTRTDLRYMDLIDLVIIASTVPGEQARQPRHKARTDHDWDFVIGGLVVKSEEATDLRRLVRRRDHRYTCVDSSAGQGDLTARRRRENNGVVSAFDSAADPARHPAIKGRCQRIESFLVCISDLECIDEARGPQLPCNARTCRAGTEKENLAHQRRSSPRNSRQPPVCGGTPPLPRTRIAAATAIPTVTATTVRRTMVINPAPTDPPNDSTRAPPEQTPGHEAWG